MTIKLKLVQKTRTEHKCECCIKSIPVGSKAINASGFDYDGNPVNEYTHPDINCGKYFSLSSDNIDDSDIEELLA